MKINSAGNGRCALGPKLYSGRRRERCLSEVKMKMREDCAFLLMSRLPGPKPALATAPWKQHFARPSGTSPPTTTTTTVPSPAPPPGAAPSSSADCGTKHRSSVTRGLYSVEPSAIESPSKCGSEKVSKRYFKRAFRYIRALDGNSEPRGRRVVIKT